MEIIMGVEIDGDSFVYDNGTGKIIVPSDQPCDVTIRFTKKGDSKEGWDFVRFTATPEKDSTGETVFDKDESPNQIVLTDHWRAPGEYKYTLYVLKKGGIDPISDDPEIENRRDGSGPGN